MGQTTIARLQILLGAMLFSTGGVAIKLSSLSGWQIAGFRAATAAVLMLVLLPAARRSFSWRTGLVAVPYAATFILYTLANKETIAANAIFLQDTAPLYLLLLGPALLKEGIGRSELSLLCALAVGALLIVTSTVDPLATAPRPRLGNLLGLASGLSWALSLLGLRWIARRPLHAREQALSAIVAGCALAFVFSSIFAFPVAAVNWLDGWIVLYLGLFQIGLAYVLITKGMQHVSALESSLLLLMEPVLTPLWAWLLLTETPTGLVLSGGAIILAATLIHTLRQRRAASG